MCNDIGDTIRRFSKKCGIIIAIGGFADHEIRVNIRGLEYYSISRSRPIPNVVDSTETPEDGSCEEDFTPDEDNSSSTYSDPFLIFDAEDEGEETNSPPF